MAQECNVHLAHSNIPCERASVTLTQANEVAALRAPRNLIGSTFGIELEFIVVYQRPRDPKPSQSTYAEPANQSSDVQKEAWFHTPEYPAQKAVYEAIARFSARPDHRNVPIHDPADEVYDSRDYSKWQLTTDGSLSLRRKEEVETLVRNQAWEGVELVSRVFHTDRDDWEGELRTALDAVLSLNGPRMQVLVNAKCGLHVHVGNGYMGIPLATQKKAMILATAFERQIDCLHALSRFHEPTSLVAALERSDDFDFNTKYNAGPAEAFAHQGHTVRSGIAAIGRCEESADGAQLMSDGRSKSCIYNLHDRLESLDPMLRNAGDGQAVRTIEFRQHRGTLFFDEIRAWVLFTTRLVGFAHETPLDRIEGMVATNFPDTKYSHSKFLRDLRMHKDVVRLYARKCKVRIAKADKVRWSQPQDTVKPANRLLMEIVNDHFVKDNSWAFVRAAVRERLEMGLYGLDDAENGYWRNLHNAEQQDGKLEVPVWLAGCKKIKHIVG